MNPPKCVTIIRVEKSEVPIRNTQHRNPQVKSASSNKRVLFVVTPCVKETVQMLCTGDPYLWLMFSHKFNRPLWWVQLFTTRVVSCEQRHGNTRGSALQGEVPAVGLSLQDASHLVARRVTGKRELLVSQRLGGSTLDIVTNPTVLSHIHNISYNYSSTSITSGRNPRLKLRTRLDRNLGTTLKDTLHKYNLLDQNQNATLRGDPRNNTSRCLARLTYLPTGDQKHRSCKGPIPMQ